MNFSPLHDYMHVIFRNLDSVLIDRDCYLVQKTEWQKKKGIVINIKIA